MWYLKLIMGEGGWFNGLSGHVGMWEVMEFGKKKHFQAQTKP